MGANKELNVRKCGEILMHVKNINKKNKMYTFHCAFCNADCDQLKKFSIHLEQQHFHHFTDELQETKEILEPEIKLEENIDSEETQSLNNVLSTKLKDGNTDPLESVENKTTNGKQSQDIKQEVEIKEDCYETNYDSSMEECDVEEPAKCSVRKRFHAKEYKEYESDEGSVDDKKDADFEIEKELNTTRRHKQRKIQQSRRTVGSNRKNLEINSGKPWDDKNKYSSDVSSYDLNDSDFDINEELNTSVKPSSAKSPLKLKKEKEMKKKIPPEPEIYSESEKELIKLLFKSYEKETYLWDRNERKRKKLNDAQIREKGYDVIANEVNEKLGTSLSANETKIRLNTMRIKYSYELEKQRKGEDHQIPWYSEHMGFLQKDMDYVIGNRTRKRFKKRATNMDESNLLRLIELYKKYDALWQVNNIAFGVIAKRDETFNEMIEDLKTNHNLKMTVENLRNHIKYINRLYSKDKEQQLQCEIENKEFTPLSPFYKELSFLAESQGPFKCLTCNEILSKYESYHKHIANHTNTMPFKCPLCEMGFPKFETYITHAKKHLGIYSYKCSFCGKGYLHKSELDWHVTSHTGEKPYLCQVCGDRFRTPQNYDNHIRRHEKRYRYKCHICNLGLNVLHHYNDHVKSHLNIRDNICNVCGKAFTSVRYLRNHKLIHDDTKRYKCEVCGKEFSQNGWTAAASQTTSTTPDGSRDKKKKRVDCQLSRYN